MYAATMDALQGICLVVDMDSFFFKRLPGSKTPPPRFLLREWLFLPKHKLELMFTSIEPYAPQHFPLFVPQTCTRIPLYFYRPMKR